MVVVKLMGGLGNQMFQYACGRRLAHARSTSLKLDVSELGAPNGRPYALCHLNISAEIAADEDIRRFKSLPRLMRWASRRAGIVSLPYLEHNVVRERFFHFDDAILSLPGDVYLEGFWQSECYFKDIETLIRREFTPRRAPAAENVDMAAAIASTNAVSVHVRRGDYVSNPVCNAFHGLCSPDYYHRAAQLVADIAARPTFFVFSDDPEWAMSNVRLGREMRYVTNNLGKNDFEDLRLMALCKHHIIANSSFSLWGAWLSGDPDKRVIAPAKWFNAPEHDTKDMIPPSWIRL
jgi:hypothetical protein